MLQQNTNQQQMPPLSEKDLSFIKDMMSWELVAAKKCFQYAHQTMEPECRQGMMMAAKVHEQNVQNLMQHLSQHVSQTVQASVSGAQPVTTHV